MKKYADIVAKDEFGRNVDQGRAILLNCLDKEQTRGFWEYRLLENMSTTHCDWIENSRVIEEQGE